MAGSPRGALPTPLQKPGHREHALAARHQAGLGEERLSRPEALVSCPWGFCWSDQGACWDKQGLKGVGAEVVCQGPERAHWARALQESERWGCAALLNLGKVRHGASQTVPSLWGHLLGERMAPLIHNKWIMSNLVESVTLHCAVCELFVKREVMLAGPTRRGSGCPPGWRCKT